MSLYYIFRAVGISFILTIIIEAGLALITGLKKKDLLLVVLVNIITNPAVIIIYLLLPYPAVTFITESVAVIIEAAYYRRFGVKIKKPYLFSLSANVLSYIIGLVINAYI